MGLALADRVRRKPAAPAALVENPLTQRALAEANVKVRELEQQKNELVWKERYGMSAPVLSSLNAEDAGDARREMARLADPLETLRDTLQDVTDDCIQRCHKAGSGNFSVWFIEMFGPHVVTPTANALRLARKPGDIEPRVAFLTFYVAYKKYREWLPRIAAALSIDEGELRGYQAWRAADAKLFDLFAFPDVPAMKELRDFLKQERNEGYPQDLNRAAIENPILGALAACTHDANRFLDLFTVEELPMRASEWDTFLPNDVYYAGVALAKTGVVAMTRTKDTPLVQFALTETTVQVWQRSGRTTPVVKQRIEINLDLVQGTGATGGGARGGSARP